MTHQFPTQDEIRTARISGAGVSFSADPREAERAESLRLIKESNRVTAREARERARRLAGRAIAEFNLAEDVAFDPRSPLLAQCHRLVDELRALTAFIPKARTDA